MEKEKINGVFKELNEQEIEKVSGGMQSENNFTYAYEFVPPKCKVCKDLSNNLILLGRRWVCEDCCDIYRARYMLKHKGRRPTEYRPNKISGI